MARQIDNIHIGIVNSQVHLEFTYNDETVENFLFDTKMARQMIDGMYQVIEAIEAQGAFTDKTRISDAAVVRLIDSGGLSGVEKN